MKIKTVLTLLTGSSVFGILFTFAFMLDFSIEGYHQISKEFLQHPEIRVICALGSLLLIISLFCSLTCLLKIDILSDIEEETDRLNKEKERFNAATQALVKTFNIDSKDLL